MESGERKRRRKSRSFRVVTHEDFDPAYVVNPGCTDGTGDSRDASVPLVCLGDEGMEIKRQITGMMRLLGDRAGRVYQRVGAEGSGGKKDDGHLSWDHQPAALPAVSEDQQSNCWSSAGDAGPSPSSTCSSIANGQSYNQYSTRSKAVRILNNTKDSIKANEAIDVVPHAAPEAPCCMCNCKGTLQAILQELRTMRRLMQTQKASLEKQEQPVQSGQPRLVSGSTPRRRPRKRRTIYKTAPLSASSRRASVAPLAPSLLIAAPLECKRKEDEEKESDFSTVDSVASEVSTLPAQNNPAAATDTHRPPLSHVKGPPSLESEVRLAEDYDVFISKAQLDSILVNYTRSGSLLFRKLVCAFFDDATLANSLPNGKRKRGLNDNRKGLDQNIVGAIKVFTEKYCTAHRIEKLPGPRDWVQILQDQIKLARRRLKRDAADAEDAFNGPCTKNQLVNLPSVSRLVTLRYESDGSGVVLKLQEPDTFMPGGSAICVK
ncbi:BEN domain-containing protein 7 [Lampris incognitus]|uniref:BEN domain-containing protein 7 n=1 Tax=Lampris incognitus TaxID=2546036 RepID=UPI0024B502FF|nr:BEN domain-containing protein 7 [Lampris incognitus]